MSRWFNTADPCQADIHYMLPPTTRLPNLEQLIEQRSYFVIHAPRQTGKTTAMLALAKQLTESGCYTAVMVSVEVGSAYNNDLGAAELAILGAWRDTIAIRLPQELQPPTWVYTEPGQRIRANLQAWAKVSSRPLVILIDEIDSLQNEALISVLRQLRDGYPNRPENFPLSGILEREYAIGNDRMDLCLKYGSVTLGIEVKVWRDKIKDPLSDGLEQLDSYLGRIGVNSGWLVIFDRRMKAPSIEERLSTQIITTKNKRSITVIRA